MGDDGRVENEALVGRRAEGAGDSGVTVDLTRVVEVRSRLDDGAAALVAVMVTELSVVVAAFFVAIPSSVRVVLAVLGGVALFGQVRIVRAGVRGFCSRPSVGRFAGLVGLCGVSAWLGSGDWTFLGSVALMAAIMSRFVVRAVRALEAVCGERSRLTDPSAFDHLTWARPAGGRERGRRHGPFERAWREISVGVAAVAVGIGLLALGIVPIEGTGRLLMVVVPAGFFVMRARRRLQLSDEEVRMVDGRPPALILRSFSDDQLRVPGRAFTIPKLTQLRGRPCTLEEVVAHGAAASGPALIIGEPGEPLPRLGAARAYASNDDWRTVVMRLMSESTRLFFIVGDTENLAWEFQTALDWHGPDSIALIIPPLRDGHVRERWTRFIEQNQSRFDGPTLATLQAAPANLIAVFFIDGAPILCTSENRKIWDYLTTLWLIAAVDQRHIDTVAQLSHFIAAHLSTNRMTMASEDG